MLELEHLNFAKKLGFVNGTKEALSDQLCLSSLNVINEISNEEITDFNRQLVITIVALVWTHSNPHIKDSLRQIMAPVLAKMGFSPSNLMLDKLLRENGVYSPFESYFDKLKIIFNELDKKVSILDKEYTLTSFQAELWRSIDESKLLGISAPTSAGKSFLIYLKIIDLIAKGASRFVYVVPTLSLISQVTSDLSKLLRQHNLRHISVLTSYEDIDNFFIYVVTQERAISIFGEEGINLLDLLVVDEIQNIEKVANEGEDRSKILYDVLIDVRNDIEVKRIILSGPRLKNIGNLGFRIFGESSSEKNTDSPPVLSLTYSISKQRNTHYLNQYSSLFDTPQQLKIENDGYIQGLNQTAYTDKFNNYLHRTLDSIGDEVNVVFSPTPSQASKSAKLYSSYRSSNEDKVLASLGDYFRESVHPKYQLANIVEKGVAYHTGKTPMHVRKSVENAASKGFIRTLFCTTTLMQGVNLPAKNVVIRSPHLFTRRSTRENVSLSAYEFANLRGRAGRLLTDFIGRTIVLDEGAFISDGLSEDREVLFAEEYKDIRTGYQDIYDDHSDFVDNALISGEEVGDEASKSLVTYIRQVLYRHGIYGIDRLKNVGLYLDHKVVTSTLDGFKSLKVGRDIILKNRYWDPFDLDLLFHEFINSNRQFPTHVFSPKLCQDLLSWMELIKDKLPLYFNRYFGNNYNSGYMYGVAKSTESWIREKPLNAILIDRFGIDDDEIDGKIDREVEKLSRHVSFSLPMMLKPLADMNGQSTSIIQGIELGMYTPISKFLSDRGVPRETAIKISYNYGKNTVEPKDIDISQMIKKSDLNSWERQHVEHLA